MSEPRSITFADHAKQHCVTVRFNQLVARDTYQLRFECPEIAAAIIPGQFVMIRLADYDDPLIGRAFALYETIDDERGDPCDIDVVYLVGGKLTGRLTTLLPGQQLSVWGPLGNGFPAQRVDHLIMVAGGIGQTPFLALAREHLGQRVYGGRHVGRVQRVTFCYGVRTAAFLAGLSDFEAAGAAVLTATEDGSAGVRGLVTDALRPLLEKARSSSESTQVVCCGPEPMMEAVARMGMVHNVPVQVSLETPMACGIGICFSCVAPVIDVNGDVDYRRTCVEGPVFDARRIDWHF